jgi:hypothetical protein
MRSTKSKMCEESELGVTCFGLLTIIFDFYPIHKIMNIVLSNQAT